MIEWLCLVLYAIGRSRVVDSRSRYGPFLRWRFYVVYVSDWIVALCETGQGQLGGCGEYMMKRLRVI
jgi:hypothetical protein